MAIYSEPYILLTPSHLLYEESYALDVCMHQDSARIYPLFL